MEQYVQQIQQQYFAGHPFIEYGVGGYLILMMFLISLKCLCKGSNKHPAHFQVVKFNQQQSNYVNEGQIQIIQEKLNVLQQDYDKLLKEHNQIRAILVDLQTKVFDVLQKKKTGQQQVRSQIIVSDQKLKEEIIQPQKQELQQVVEEKQQDIPQQIQEEQIITENIEKTNIVDQEKKEEQTIQQFPSQTNPFEQVNQNQIRKPVNPPTPRRLPPNIRPK